jgi:hypothetical protein
MSSGDKHVGEEPDQQGQTAPEPAEGANDIPPPEEGSPEG